MPWLKSEIGPVIIALDPEWPLRDDIWNLSDEGYRRASEDLHDQLGRAARTKHDRARALQARSNRQHGVTRRARVRGAAGSHTAVEWEALVARYRGRCAYCRKRRPLTRDHVVPIARGGSNAIDNIVPACLSCNSRKGARV